MTGVLFLDIETDGVDVKSALPSAVGTLDEFGSMDVYTPRQFLSENEGGGQFCSLRLGCDTLVTFNGVDFDVPILRRLRGVVEFKRHVDLMRVLMEHWTNRSKSTDEPYRISKDAACRELGIYVPKDPLGSGKHCALIGKRILSGAARPGDALLISEHLAGDLFATAKLYDFCVREGWVQ